MTDGAKPRVAAVFATMNRRNTALECVRRLKNQTLPVDRILVADNRSSDGTAETLREAGAEVLEQAENLGNAGGVAAAMERAFSEGAEVVWILDDDSWPRVEALEAMMEHFADDLVVHPVQITPDGEDLSWPMQVERDGRWCLVENLEEVPDGAFRTRAGWTGALIPKRIREAAGPVKGELFIRGEDEEYPRRIRAAGFGFLGVRNAMLDHPGGTGVRRWSILGRSLFHEPGLAPWKFYYKVRNMVWLSNEEAGWPKGVSTALAYLLIAIRFDGIRGGRLRVWWRAVSDGIAGRLGKVDHDAL